MSEPADNTADDEEPIFGQTMVNGKEFDAVLDVKSPDGRATYGMSYARMNAIAQLLREGLRNTDVPENVERDAENIIRSLTRIKPIEEVAEEVAERERARGAI